MSTTVETFLTDDESRALYAEEAFLFEAMESLCDWMEEVGCTRAELARRMHVSAPAVTQMLAGGNVGLRRLARAVHALGGVPEFRISPAGERSHLDLTRALDPHVGTIWKHGESEIPDESALDNIIYIGALQEAA